MAKIDLIINYKKMLNQYLECKRDLADFEQALKDGYITEDKLTEVYDDVAKLEINYFRIANIMFELEKPQNKKKREKWMKQNKDLVDAFKELNADTDSVEDENESLLADIKVRIEQIKKENTNNR